MKTFLLSTVLSIVLFTSCKTENSTDISTEIDSFDYQTEFILARSYKDELGFETYISTKSIEEGKHLLKVNRLRIRKDDTTQWPVSRIPFWYYRN